MALFTTFGMEKDDNIRFVCGCFRTRRYAKRWFPKDGVRRVEGLRIQEIEGLYYLCSESKGADELLCS